MIKIGFIGPNREIIRFNIEEKRVVYLDKIWKEGIQIYPLDHSLILKLKANRHPNIKMMAALILDANQGKDLEEYNSCKTEEEIAEFIRRDCKQKGLMEIK